MLDHLLIGGLIGWEALQTIMLAYILIGIWRLRNE